MHALKRNMPLEDKKEVVPLFRPSSRGAKQPLDRQFDGLMQLLQEQGIRTLENNLVLIGDLVKLVRWEFNELHIPMLHTEQYGMCCTSKALAGALGVTEVALRVVHNRHKTELHPICVTDCNAILFLKAHREEFDVSYVRKDMVLWPLRQALVVAHYSKSKIAASFLQASFDLVEQHARTSYITEDKYNALLSRVDQLQIALVAGQPALDAAASAAGAALRAQRGIRHLRVVR